MLSPKSGLRFQQEDYEEEGITWLVFPWLSKHHRRGLCSLARYDGKQRGTGPALARSNGTLTMNCDQSAAGPVQHWYRGTQ